MDTLRIILIIIGIAFVFGIYLFQTNASHLKNIFSEGVIFQLIQKNCRRCVEAVNSGMKHFFKSNVNSQNSEPIKHPQNQLSSEQLASMSNMIASKPHMNANENNGVQLKSKSDGLIKNEVVEHSRTTSVAKGGELLITLTVLPKPDSVFKGEDIISACKMAGMQLGEYNIFHRYALVNEKVLMTPVCSLVNLFEPGYFELSSIDEFTTEGLSLFMQLPGPIDSREAFVILMNVSEKLSLHLNATICDETRSVLTAQTVSHLKEKVENYRFKLKMDSIKHH